jgi:hypothetical protein
MISPRPGLHCVNKGLEGVFHLSIKSVHFVNAVRARLVFSQFHAPGRARLYITRVGALILLIGS